MANGWSWHSHVTLSARVEFPEASVLMTGTAGPSIPKMLSQAKAFSALRMAGFVLYFAES